MTGPTCEYLYAKNSFLLDVIAGQQGYVLLDFGRQERSPQGDVQFEGGPLTAL